MKTYKARVKAFSGDTRKEWHRIAVDGNTVRVWDPIASAFTRCHSIPKAVQARILALAARR